MLLPTRKRRQRAAMAKLALVGTLAALLLTPRMDTATLGDLAQVLPGPVIEETPTLILAMR